MTQIGQYPTVQRYNRMPTRMKVRLFWACAISLVVYYQGVKLGTTRSSPKWLEHRYLQYEKEMPEEVMKRTASDREMRDTYSLHNMLRVPTPGEFSVAMKDELNPSRLAVESSFTKK